MSKKGIGGVDCDECGGLKTAVIDSRPTVGGIRRVRKCLTCDHRFVTFEYRETELPDIDGILGIADQIDSNARRMKQIGDTLRSRFND